MLEGKEEEHSYFLSMVVSAQNENSAIDNCLREAQLMGMEIVGVEEINQLEGDFPEVARVIEVSGRSYFTE